MAKWDFSWNFFPVMYESPQPMAATQQKTPGTVGTTSLLIGSMSLGLAVGLGVLGFWDHANELLTSWMTQLGGEARKVPTQWILVMAALMAYLPPFAMLLSPGLWRRLVLWISAMILAIAWIPVLALAAWQMPPCLPLVAGFWSGLCALVYASRHILPCEVVIKDVPLKKIVIRDASITAPVGKAETES
jgi:hypothetical protein